LLLATGYLKPPQCREGLQRKRRRDKKQREKLTNRGDRPGNFEMGRKGIKKEKI